MSIKIHNRLHDLARAPTIAPSAVYANACRDGAEAIKTLHAEIARLKEAKRKFSLLCDEKGAENVKLRAALKPFVEIARRLGWDKIADDHMTLGDHVVEAPADDIAKGAVYCLMVGAFREAARSVEQREPK